MITSNRFLRTPSSMAWSFLVMVLTGPLLAGPANAAEEPIWSTHGGEKVLIAARQQKDKQKRNTAPVKRPSEDFDHLLTGFPLFGSHLNADCGDCHLRGILRGTPVRCEECHGLPGQRSSSFKPLTHIETRDPCELCHNEGTFAGALFNHFAVAPGTCLQCHNGSTAPGLPGGHMTTTLACDQCHRTTGWIPALYKHRNVAPGTCETCHGVTATGKPPTHVETFTYTCDDCHSFGTWLGARFKHTGTIAGTCLNCHGTTAAGLPGGHIPAPMSCDACHGTTSFSTSTMANHDVSQGVVPDGCLDCHNGSYTSQGAAGLFAGHIPAPMSCDACHGTTRFTTSTMANHDVSQGVVPGGCLTCHNGAYRSQGARGLPNEHDPIGSQSCDACHTTRNWDT